MSRRARPFGPPLAEARTHGQEEQEGSKSAHLRTTISGPHSETASCAQEGCGEEDSGEEDSREEGSEAHAQGGESTPQRIGCTPRTDR